MTRQIIKVPCDLILSPLKELVPAVLLSFGRFVSPCVCSFHLMKDWEMAPVNRVTPEYICADGITRIFGLLGSTRSAGLCCKAREGMQLMSRCMRPQNVIFV